MAGLFQQLHKSALAKSFATKKPSATNNIGGVAISSPQTQRLGALLRPGKRPFISSIPSPTIQRTVDPEPADALSSSEPDPVDNKPATELVLTNQVASFDFIGSRLKDFRKLEKMALQLKSLLDQHPTATMDIVTIRNMGTPGRPPDAAAGLLTILTKWFGFPKERFRLRKMVDSGEVKGKTAVEQYSRAVLVFPSAQPASSSPFFNPSLPIFLPSATGATTADISSSEIPTAGGLDLDIDLSKITDHDIDIKIGTFKIRLPSSIEQHFKGIPLGNGSSLRITLKSAVELGKLFGGSEEEQPAESNPLAEPEEEKPNIPFSPSLSAAILINGQPKININAAPIFNLNNSEFGASVSLGLTRGDCHYVVPAESVTALRQAPAAINKIQQEVSEKQTRNEEIDIVDVGKSLGENIFKVYSAVKKIENAKTQCTEPNIEIGASVRQKEFSPEVEWLKPVPELQAELGFKMRFDVPGTPKPATSYADYDWALKWLSLPENTKMPIIRSGQLLKFSYAARESNHIELVRKNTRNDRVTLIYASNNQAATKQGWGEFMAPSVDGFYEIRLLDSTDYVQERLGFVVGMLPKPAKEKRPDEKVPLSSGNSAVA